jgi:hypothetical protein
MYKIEKENRIVDLYNLGYNLTIIEKMIRSDHRTIKSVLANKGIHIRSLSEISRKYKFDYNYFDNIDTENKAYWLGFIVADGNISKEENDISVVSKDEGHLYKLKNDLRAKNPVYYIKRDNTYYLRFCSKHTKDSLIKIGVLPNKSLIVTTPHIDKELERDFWRGVVDGDGWISYYKNQDIYCIGLCGSFDIVSNFICFVTSKLGLIKKKPSSKNNIYEVKYTGSRAKSISDLLYNGAGVYLERKMRMYEKLRREK